MTEKRHIMKVKIVEGRDYMSFLDSVIINSILVASPLLIYLVYVAYRENINEKENNLFLSLALISSLYITMRYGMLNEENVYITVLFNIPLLISYYKKRNFTSIFLSILLVLYSTFALKYNFYGVLLEYTLYYILFALVDHQKLTRNFVIHTFVIIKAFLLSLQTYYFTNVMDPFWINFRNILIGVLLLYFISYAAFYLLEKGEEIMDLNQAMRSLEKEKSLRSALFKITHEIKNPIAVCKGYLDMLDLNDSPKVHQYIPIIQKEIARTLTLMDDFLDYTKVKVEKEPIDLYYLLEDTVSQLKPLLEQRGIKTDFKIPDDELYCYGDYNRLKQVFINLFKNAKESKKEKKTLHLKLRSEQKDGMCTITLEDDGIGMDEETLERIGEMFYTTKKQGTGLGVTLSKEIIELHQGELKYQSILGQGTKVTIQLPVMKEEV